MDKKAAFAFFLLLISSVSTYSSSPDKSMVEMWVDSVYSSLTNEERIGQLIISKNSDKNTVDLIKSGALPIGGIFTAAGNVFEANAQKSFYQQINNRPFWVFASPEDLRYNQEIFFPDEISKAAMPNIETVKKLERAEAGFFKRSGGNIYIKEDTYLENINGEFILHESPSLLPYAKQKELAEIKNGYLKEQGVVSAIPLNLSFDNYNFVKYIPDELYLSDEWNAHKSEHAMLILDKLDFKRGWHPDKFKKEIVKDLIRKKFNYEGVIGIDIQKFDEQFTKLIYRNAVELDLIGSGIDVIITNDPQRAFKNLYTNWENHDLKNSELEEKVKNILRQKYQKLKTNDHSPSNSIIENTVYEAYAESITLLENEGNAIPLKNLEIQHLASLSIGSEKLTKFQETLGQYAGFTHFVLPANQINADAFISLVNKLSTFDQVVVGIHAPLNKDMLSLLSTLETKANIITTLFDENVPDNLETVTNSLLITYENNDYVQELAPQIIFGARPCHGNFPLLSGREQYASIHTEAVNRLAFAKPYSVGIQEEKLNEVDSIAQLAIQEGATPGCQVLVAKNGKVVYEKSFGNYSYANTLPVSNRTIYDIASITKVASTTQTIMFLADQGVLDINKPLSFYLPELAQTNKGDLIIRDVLTHQSGLKAFLPFWYHTIDFENIQIPFYSNKMDEEYQLEVGFGMYGSLSLKDSLYSWTAKSELRKKPRRKRFEPYDYKYSDLGFYLMYKLAERLINQPMDEFLAQNLYEPLGMSSTTFNPLCHFPASYIAPTEDDKTFRHSLVWGTVHDQVAAMNGGVSGHAGLFSNAIDLAKLGQMHLQHGKYGGQKYFSSGIIEEFTSVQNKDNRRGLGWDKPDPSSSGYNPTSRYASNKTFGHRGFTGTVIWVDPEQDLIYVFLSNRIYPEMSNGKLNELDIRKKIHDVVYESIVNFEPELN